MALGKLSISPPGTASQPFLLNWRHVVKQRRIAGTSQLWAVLLLDSSGHWTTLLDTKDNVNLCRESSALVEKQQQQLESSLSST